MVIVFLKTKYKYRCSHTNTHSILMKVSKRLRPKNVMVDEIIMHDLVLMDIPNISLKINN
jgi:hypothetical protein